MNYFFRSRYEFENFEYPYRFKMKIKNGAMFKFLNNYYKYNFYIKENEQYLYCYSLLNEDNIDAAERSMEFSNKVIQFIFSVPIEINDIKKIEGVTTENNFSNSNIASEKLNKLEFISNRVLRFNIERKLFEEVMNLYSIAFKNQVHNRIEDAILYYFKIIEKLAKKNFIKFHEKNYTKNVKKRNKEDLHTFLEKYFNENMKIQMTENMLNTAVDEIYKFLRNEAYSSIFLKISFFCNLKNLSIDKEKLNDLVRTRNKLAHGDNVDEDTLGKALTTAFNLSQQFISLYFFQRKYNEILIDTDFYEDM